MFANIFFKVLAYGMSLEGFDYWFSQVKNLLFLKLNKFTH